MKRIDVKSIEDIVKVADVIIEMSAKTEGVEVWHPSLVWGAPTLMENWDEITSHSPKPISIRITTQDRIVTVKDFWKTNEMEVDYYKAQAVRLQLLVAHAIKEWVDFKHAVIDIDVDWESVVPIEIHAEKVRRPRRPRR